VDSPADTFDIDHELEQWIEKTAVSTGVDPNQYMDELAVIKRFQQSKSPQDFEWLYNRHRPLIASAMRSAIGSTTLPKSAANAHALKWYIDALEKFDPDRGAQFKTFLTMPMYRMRRWRNRYQNVNYIPPDRVGSIPLIQERERALTEMLGRPPSDSELADDVNIARKELEHMRKVPPQSAKDIARIRREVRQDLLAEAKGGEVLWSGPTALKERMVMLYDTLSPEDQLVLEYTFGDIFGKPTIEDPAELGRKINMSPQKVRATRKRIVRKAERF